MSAFFDYIQTFYVNSDAVNNAEEIMITSVELYFKGKPSLASNISNLAGPGISAWICEVNNDQPSPERVMNNSITTVPYERINTSTNATTATTISFKAPIVVKTNRSYGIVIKYSDPAFDIWYNKQSDALVSTTGKTTTASQGSQGRFIGMMYKATSATEKTAYTDRDLKFKVNIAKFTVNNTTFSFVNRNYEFFTISSTSGSSFIGGETVYQDIANATGTVTTSSSSTTVTGSGTTFTNHAAGQYILVANATHKSLAKIAGITSATSMTLTGPPPITGTGFNYKVPPVGIVAYTDYTNSSNITLYLVDSNAANATFKFVPGIRLIGERSGASANLSSMWAYSADNVTPKLRLKTSSQSSYTISYKTVNETYNLVDTSSRLLNLYNNEAQTGWDAYMLSRSQEVDTTFLSPVTGSTLTLYGTNRKSMVVNVAMSTVTTGTSFSVPYINSEELDIFVYQNKVSATTKDGTGYDTETTKNGLSESKYISKKITFAENKFAEDTLVYLTGYRPAGTSIQVYVKTHNSSDKEMFDDKSWSPLEIKDNLEKYSANENDYIEYTYGLPQYPETLTVLSGKFTVQNPANAVILTTTNHSATVTAGDLVRVYDPLLPNNHEVFVALSSNTTAITVNKKITNVNLIGNMAVDKLRYRNVAWNNIANDNVARYVSTSLVEYDTYNSMQLKIVLLADKTYVAPKVGQIQVIGVSA